MKMRNEPPQRLQPESLPRPFCVHFSFRPSEFEIIRNDETRRPDVLPALIHAEDLPWTHELIAVVTIMIPTITKRTQADRNARYTRDLIPRTTMPRMMIGVAVHIGIKRASGSRRTLMVALISCACKIVGPQLHLKVFAIRGREIE